MQTSSKMLEICVVTEGAPSVMASSLPFIREGVVLSLGRGHIVQQCHCGMGRMWLSISCTTYPVTRGADILGRDSWLSLLLPVLCSSKVWTIRAVLFYSACRGRARRLVGR